MLLILAVVAIRAVQGEGILLQAKKAGTEYNKAQENETVKLQGYEQKIEEALGKKEYISDSFEEETSPYIGYYADVDGNGTVDGIIYADLSKAGSGQWTNSDGAYSWTAETNLKKYYISQDKYKVEGLAFEEKPVLTAEGEGNDRFYVMALSNFTVTSGETTRSTFTWYSSKYGRLNTSRTDLTMGMTTYNDKRISYGEANTLKMIEDWNADKSESKVSTDVWGVIQEEVKKGWFVPSRAEWAAFADAFKVSKTSGEEKYYGNFGLSRNCWSSSIDGSSNAWLANFIYGCMSLYNVGNYICVRLCTTF